MTRVVVFGPSELARTCMVAGLADVLGVRAEACVNGVGHDDPTPDMILLMQDTNDLDGSPRLAAQLDDLRRRWPDAAMAVLACADATTVQLCRAAGVRACLPLHVDLDHILAAIRLASADLVVYPASDWAQPKAGLVVELIE